MNDKIHISNFPNKVVKHHLFCDVDYLITRESQNFSEYGTFDDLLYCHCNTLSEFAHISNMKYGCGWVFQLNMRDGW